jgi:hypothetical protein
VSKHHGRVERAALAFTLSGEVLVNAASFDGPDTPRALLLRALEQKGRVFVGVTLSVSEAAEAIEWLRNAEHEGAGHIIGRRQRRRRRKVTR